MMGQQVEQAALFYELCLEEQVPANHLLRRVNAVLDLSFVCEHMAEHYSTLGRPSVCPELMVRMLLVGYLFGVRSERTELTFTPGHSVGADQRRGCSLLP